MPTTPNYDVEKMRRLKESGMSFYKVAKEMNCSPETVKYHLIPGRKGQIKSRNEKQSWKYSLALKRRQFLRRAKGNFTLQELKDKIGPEPKCYLTNESINLFKPETYSLDHIQPTSRGGTSDLDNAGLIRLDINLCKSNRTLEEFFELCKKVLVNNGYIVTKI